MNLKNSMRIMKKDWNGTIKRKEILLPMILLPVLFALGLPIMMISIVLIDPEEIAKDFGDMAPLLALLDIPEDYNVVLQYSIYMMKIMILPFFLMIPAIIPVMIASDSFAGEKERKTMESIALLPVSKSELIIGKVMTSFIPSIVITFACFGALGLIMNIMLIDYLEGFLLVFEDLSFVLITFLLSPLLALLNIMIGTIVSSRSKDLKSAQSISGVVITPVIVVLFVQMFNPAFLSPLMILILSAAVGGLCVIFLDIANRLLDIERLILTL